LYCGKALRDFGDGFVAVLLPLYLIRLGYSSLAVGALAAAALFGSALLTLAVGAFGARFDPRRLLLVGSALMAATGAALATSDAYPVLVATAFIGTVNPTAGSASAFVPVEHALLSREADPTNRTKVFARYSLVGALAGASGALSASLPDLLEHAGFGQLLAVRAMFLVYALLGVCAGFSYARIPRLTRVRPKRTASALGPSRHTVYRLAALFGLDAFAGGLSSSRCYPCGCSKSSTCRSRPPLHSFSGPASSPPFLSPSRRDWQTASV
jgi:MFS family permease